MKKRTIANLSKLPDEVVDNLKLALKGASAIKTEQFPSNFEVIRSLPHGHVSAVLKTLKQLGLSKLIDVEKTRKRSLVEAMIVARIIQIRKLAETEGMQFGIFDQRNLMEMRSDLYPNERLILCRNPLVAEKNKIKRAELIKKTTKRIR